jgi:threonine/homoserine efflux transporter RhtA
VVYGVVAIAGGQLCYFNAIESIPIGLAVLLEYLGVVLIVGWLWAVRGQRPGG